MSHDSFLLPVWDSGGPPQNCCLLLLVQQQPTSVLSSHSASWWLCNSDEKKQFSAVTFSDMQLTTCLHGTEFFLKSKQLLSLTRSTPHFMEPTHLLSCSEEFVTDSYPYPYPPPNLVNAIPYYFFKIPSNVILPCMPGYSKWSLPFRFTNQNFVCISHLFRSCYMPCPFNLS